jgi:hypothetical protein
MRHIPAIFLLHVLAGCGSQHSGSHATPGGAPGALHGGHGHSHTGHAGSHVAGSLVVQTDPSAPAAGRPTALRLMIHDADGTMAKDFLTVHDKKVHLIIVRDGLDEFAHLHPDIDAAGTMTTTYTFPIAGTYRLFADYHQVGRAPATARAEVAVSGEARPAPALRPDAPGVVSGDGLTAEVAVEGAAAGGEATIRFTLTDPNGRPVADLQPYMGAMGHLVVVSGDGRKYVHAHSAEGNADRPNVVSFQAHFPHAGFYKGWGQFRWKDNVRVVPFVVKVS